MMEENIKTRDRLGENSCHMNKRQRNNNPLIYKLCVQINKKIDNLVEK